VRLCFCALQRARQAAGDDGEEEEEEEEEDVDMPALDEVCAHCELAGNPRRGGEGEGKW
jgi:hypothetical protein